MIPSLLPAITRTIVPFIVAFVIGLPVTPRILDLLGITTDQASAYVGSATTVVIGGVYYILVRLLERARSSKWGVLLGSKLQPLYRRPGL